MRDARLPRTAAILVALLPLCAGQGRADPPASVYRGWIEADRWGALWLSNGVHSVRFEDAVRGRIDALVGKPVEIRTGALPPGSTPAPPTIGTIDAVAQTEARLGRAASLDLNVGDARSRAGEHRRMRISLRLTPGEELEFRVRDLRILLRRRGPALALDAAIECRDDDDLAWRSDGRSTQIGEDSSHDTTWVLRAPGEGIVRAKGEFSYSVDLSTHLPEGAYEAWAVLSAMGSDNLSTPPGIRHGRVAFDVLR